MSTAIERTENGDLWVFGYGSLMWDPGFDYLERSPATLYGYHRAFCIYSHRYRGTPECPGLVLGLDRGGSCRGMAYRVAASDVEDVLAYLHHREMLHYVYIPRMLRLYLAGGRTARAHTYVADRQHKRYARLDIEEQVRLIAQGAGDRGDNREYLENTVRHLDALGIADGALHRLQALVQQRAK